MRLRRILLERPPVDARTGWLARRARSHHSGGLLLVRHALPAAPRPVNFPAVSKCAGDAGPVAKTSSRGARAAAVGGRGRDSAKRSRRRLAWAVMPVADGLCGGYGACGPGAQPGRENSAISRTRPARDSFGQQFARTRAAVANTADKPGRGSFFAQGGSSASQVALPRPPPLTSRLYAKHGTDRGRGAIGASYGVAQRGGRGGVSLAPRGSDGPDVPGRWALSLAARAGVAAAAAVHRACALVCTGLSTTTMNAT
jgi:hypothetical protein